MNANEHVSCYSKITKLLPLVSLTNFFLLSICVCSFFRLPRVGIKGFRFENSTNLCFTSTSCCLLCVFFLILFYPLVSCGTINMTKDERKTIVKCAEKSSPMSIAFEIAAIFAVSVAAVLFFVNFPHLIFCPNLNFLFLKNSINGQKHVAIFIRFIVFI